MTPRGESPPGLRATAQGVEFSAWGFDIQYAVHAKDNAKGRHAELFIVSSVWLRSGKGTGGYSGTKSLGYFA